MSYLSDYEMVNLMNKFIEVETRLRVQGQLYDGVEPVGKPSEMQRQAMDLNREGCDYGIQIHNSYSFLGSILQEIEKR